MKKLVILSLTIIIFLQASSQVWEWLNPLPQGNSLESVFFASENTGYAVGLGGAMLKTTDGGGNWTLLPLVTDLNLYSTYFISEDTGFVVGGNFGDAIILKTVDGGVSWSNKIFSGIYALEGVFFPNDSIGYAVGLLGKILKTTDYGENWIDYSISFSINLKSVFFTNINTGYAVGAFGKIYKTIDGGLNWILTDLNLPSMYDLKTVFFVNENIGFTAGGGWLFRTLNGGENWEQLSYSNVRSYRSMYFSNPDTGYITGGDLGVGMGLILKTTDGGTNWQQETIGTFYLNSVFFTASNCGHIVGTNGTIMKTVNGGESWSFYNSGINDKDFNSIFFTDSNTGYVVGEHGKILKTTNGITWDNQSSGVNYTLNEIFFVNQNIGYIVGASNKILKTMDAGTSWYLYTLTGAPTTMSDMESVYFLDENTGYVAGNGLYKTIDGGQTWSVLDTSPIFFLHSVFFVNYDIGYIGSDDYNSDIQIFKSTDGGATWLPSNLITTSSWINAMFFVNPLTGYVVAGKTVYKTNDGGISWSSQILSINFNCYSVYFANLNTGWIASGPNIYRTDDGGISWTSEETGAMVKLYSIFFAAPNICYTTGSDGVILKSNVDIISSESNMNNIPNSLIFPNPASDKIYIELPELFNPEKTDIYILNMIGQILMTKRPPLNGGIPIEYFAPGVYLLKIREGNNCVVMKFIKK